MYMNMTYMTCVHIIHDKTGPAGLPMGAPLVPMAARDQFGWAGAVQEQVGEAEHDVSLPQMSAVICASFAESQ